MSRLKAVQAMSFAVRVNTPRFSKLKSLLFIAAASNFITPVLLIEAISGAVM